MSSMKQALSFDAEILGPWVAEKCGGKWTSGRGTAIGRIDENGPFAGILYEDWNGSQIVCHIAGDGNWLNRLFLWIIFDYPFNQIGAKMMTAPICSTNIKSIRMVEHMGFELEGRLRGATSKGDLLLYVMRKENCKYLRGRYVQRRLGSSST